MKGSDGSVASSNIGVSEAQKAVDDAGTEVPRQKKNCTEEPESHTRNVCFSVQETLATTHQSEHPSVAAGFYKIIQPVATEKN